LAASRSRSSPKAPGGFRPRAELAEGDQILRQRAILELDTLRARRQVGGGLSTRTPPRRDEYVVRMQRDSAVAVERGQQQRESVGSSPTARRRGSWARESSTSALHLDQHRPRALARHGDDRSGDRRFVARQENGGRVLDVLDSALVHREHADFVGGAEAILTLRTMR